MSTDVFRRATTLAGLVLALMLGPAPAALAQKVGFNCVTDGGTNCTNAIPDATGQTPGALTSTITVPSGACPTVGRVCVSLGVEHSWRGDLSVDLTHGATTSTLLAASPGDDGDDVFRSFVLGAPHAGGSGDGAWTLTLRDNANGEYGALNNWKLGLCCGDGCGAGLVSATPASGLVTTELGGTAQFRVELSCPPDVQVTLPVASSDASEGVAGVTSLVFTAANQAQPQTVTVTGQDDNLVDGNIPYTVNLGTATLGAAFGSPVIPADLYNPPSVYLGSSPINVGVVNIDNEQVTGGLRATKTVVGVFQPGGAATYTVTITNSGPGTQQDNPGAEFTDVLPAGLTLLSATATAGAAVATVATNTVTWNGALAVNATATITITARINEVPAGTQISNQGALAFDADGNGSNEAQGATDDPALPGVADPTVFGVFDSRSGVGATKTVAGEFSPDGVIAYTVTITNAGPGAQQDNPGAEFTDVLPASLTLLSATATAGTAVATVATNAVIWNGALAAGASATITITARINADQAGQTIGNQGALAFDADGDGSNESGGVTDDPGVAGLTDPTRFVVSVAIPTISTWGLALLGAILAAMAWYRRRRAI